MSVDIGIVGLPKSGRTTVFNALTGGQTDTSRHSHEAASAHLGMASVPEPRLNALAEVLKPKRIVAASVRYVDVGASVRDLAKGAGPLLNQLSAVDALINVVRAFRDDSLPHVAGSLDVDRDIADMDLELTFSDLVLVDRRLGRVADSMKGAKPPERALMLKEQETLGKIRAALDAGTPVRALPLSAEEAKALSSFQLLSAKRLLIVVNVGEEQLRDAARLEADLNGRYGRAHCRVITLCGKLEMELAQLPAADAEVMRSSYGLTESGADRVIKQSYELLGLITFFTIASGEVRAWPIISGTEASRAAGKIHTDMERGFIRAEVIGCADLLKCGSIAEARKRGLLRLEGAGYTVRDGDVITFLFNV